MSALSQYFQTIEGMTDEPLQASNESTPTLARPGILVMDVDSTLIDQEVIDELGVAAGVGGQIAAVTARAMAGELEFCEALRERVKLLAGLPVSVFDEVYHRITFTNGALDLIDALHQHGWTVGVVSDTRPTWANGEGNCRVSPVGRMPAQGRRGGHTTCRPPR